MAKREVILIGGGGHCRSCIDVIESTGEYQIAGIIDTIENQGKSILGYKIIGTDQDLPALRSKYNCALVTIGQLKSAAKRIAIYNELSALGFELATIISREAYVSKSAKLGEGTIIMHNAVVNSEAVIGVNCIVNTKALIEHDCVIGNHCHISTGAIINGTSKLGSQCFIGSGARVSNNVRMADRVVISIGSVVKKDIDTHGIYYGN